MNVSAFLKRTAIKSIKTTEEYQSYMNALKLTKLQRDIVDMVFINNYPYAYIGDVLGYSESTIKRKMQEIYLILL